MKINGIIFYFILIPSLFSSEYQIYKYEIKWKGILIGYAQMGIYGIIEYQNEPCYILQTTAYNTPFLQTFYPVKDRIVSYWSVQKQIPYYSEKNLNEGNYHRHQKSFFYYDKKEIYWIQKEFSGNVKNRENRWKFKEGNTKIIENTQDILSAIFYNKFSKKQPYVGAKFSIPLFDDTKLTELHIHIIEKQKIKVKLNNDVLYKDAWIVKPFYDTTGLFRLAGDLTIWISDDINRDILKMTAKIPYIGIINVELIEINN